MYGQVLTRRSKDHSMDLTQMQSTPLVILVTWTTERMPVTATVFVRQASRQKLWLRARKHKEKRLKGWILPNYRNFYINLKAYLLDSLMWEDIIVWVLVLMFLYHSHNEHVCVYMVSQASTNCFTGKTEEQVTSLHLLSVSNNRKYIANFSEWPMSVLFGQVASPQELKQ